MDNNFKDEILQTCRTCMKEISNESFLYLNCTPAANTQLTIREKLHSCIPELDLSIVSHPVLCSACVDNLLSAYEFKKNCLQSEIQINKYIQQVQHIDDLNLVEVVRFQYSDVKTLDNVEVKMEDLESTKDFKNEYLICDSSAFNEASECTELKYPLKLEMVDRQYVPINTFDDFNINYNLPAAKEKSDTHNSNIAQSCLSEVTEHQDNNIAYNQCYKCGHKAESKFKLILHLKRHTRKQNFLYQREIISKRLSMYHKDLFSYYRCSLCNYFTKYKCLFDFHNRIHLTKKDYKHIFNYTYVHTKSFHTTIKVHKTHLKHNKRNNLKQHLKQHIRIHTGEKPFSCSVCKYQCSRKSHLKQHMQIHTGEKPFSCSFCEYQCRQKQHLKQHIQIHTGEKPFSCSIYGYQCSRKADLKEHVRIHTGEKPFSCSVCKYQCSRKGHLKQHMRIHTGEKPFSCSVCGYQCSRKADLKKHVRIHTGEKPFSCSVCEYQCNRKSNLKKHMGIHTGEKPFSCSVCGYQCSQKDNLKKHMQIHTGEKPFSCSVCGYQCSQKDNLKKHMIIHTGKKPFSCSVCGYQCSRNADLKKHVRIHTGEKPFSCSVCEYQCSQKSSLKPHMRIHTGEKPF